jgi:hypothetical protein
MVKMSPKQTRKNSKSTKITVAETASGEFLLYQTEDGRTRVQVRVKDESVWLSLNQLSELFGRDKSTISKHISNIFEERELLPDRTVAKFATVQNEGTRSIAREIEHYNLDVIISYIVLLPRRSLYVQLTPFENAGYQVA